MALQDDLDLTGSNLTATEANLVSADTSVTAINTRISALLANQITPAQSTQINSLAAESTAVKTHSDSVASALTTIATTTP